MNRLIQEKRFIMKKEMVPFNIFSNLRLMKSQPTQINHDITIYYRKKKKEINLDKLDRHIKKLALQSQNV